MAATKALVVGAPRQPLPFGLFSVADIREGGDTWIHGVTFETLPCEPAGGYSDSCTSGEAVGLPRTAVECPALGESTSFTVSVLHERNPVGLAPSESQNRAAQHLTTREEARVEKALWTGDLGNVPNFAGANGYAAPVDAGSFPIAEAWNAVAAIEQEIAETYGSVGVIHMSREVATMLTKLGKLEVKGTRLQTPLQTPVVAGTGYGSDKIVGTPAIFGYRGAINTYATPGALLERGQNTLHLVADRDYLIAFDPCGVVSATLTTP